jgi:hypothetical protein
MVDLFVDRTPYAREEARVQGVTKFEELMLAAPSTVADLPAGLPMDPQWDFRGR